MKRFLAAVQFLTIFPVGVNLDKDDVAKSSMYFPLVGLLIGLIGAAVSMLCHVMSQIVVVVMILIVLYLVSGALHLDGFADTFDGLYGFKEKEKRLLIMRDSCVGVMGAVAIVLLLILKFAIFSDLSLDILWKLIVVSCVISRWAMVLSCFAFSYAREDGKARVFIDNTGIKEILVTTLFTGLVLFVMFSIKGLFLMGISYVFVYLFGLWIKSKIDGMTGDTIGAVSEFAEATVLLVGLVLL